MANRALEEKFGGGTGVTTALDKASENQIEAASKALKDALTAGSAPLAARELLRMLQLGASSPRVALEIAAFDALHGEHGSGLALSIAADVARLGVVKGVSEALGLLHVAEVAMDGSKHRAPRRVPASQDPGREADAAGARLSTLVEERDAEAADGLVRGALWRKWGSEVVEPWLLEINTTHFFDGGDGLVATVGAFDLLSRAGFEHARRILPGLVFALGRARRDDESEEWAWFRQRYAQLVPRLAELWERQGKRAVPDDERNAITRAVLDGSRDEAWHAVIGALASGAPAEAIIDALTRAASERLWRVDPKLAAEGGSDQGLAPLCRHLLYMRALRSAAARHRKPSLLRLVLFAVHGVHQRKRCDQPAERWLAVDNKGRMSIADRELLLGEMREHIAAHEASEAERMGLAYLALGGSPQGLGQALTVLVLEGHFARSESTARALQLIAAAAELATQLPEGDRAWPLRALIRTLALPIREHSLAAILQDAKQALG